MNSLEDLFDFAVIGGLVLLWVGLCCLPMVAVVVLLAWAL